MKLGELLRTGPGDLTRRVWYRLVMGGAGQNDPFKQLNRMYILKDPWRLDAPSEHKRHRATSQLIESLFGRVGTMLEVGAGEGVQTEYLQKHCEKLTAIETSPRALKRARRRVPAAEIHLGQLHEQPWANERAKFDVVTAVEVINHMGDVAGFLDRISRLGRACFITYFAQNRGPLDPIVSAIPGAERTTVRFGERDEKESIVWWWAGCRESRLDQPGEGALVPRGLNRAA